METDADLYTVIPSSPRFLNAAVAEDYFLATILAIIPPAANAPLESAMAAQHTTAWWMTVGAVVLDTERLTEARAAVIQ